MNERLEIVDLGAKGDGIAEGPTFVPFALPGETVGVERTGSRARLVEVLTASPERQPAPCPHFGVCGGCDLQHASDDLYRVFKRDRVVEAFRREALEPEIGPLVPCAPRTRRRAVFTAIRAGGAIRLGFHEAGTHTVASIETCFVVVPEIVTALPLLRQIAGLLTDKKRETRLTVTATGTGLDIAVDDAAKMSESLRQEAVRAAIAGGVARLSVAGEILVEQRRPVVIVDGVSVAPPPGTFLQAVASAEEEMARLVCAHLSGPKPVADLFSGVGAFALRLARTHAVHAFETDAPALAALETARRSASGLKDVTCERRDLYRRPVTSKELNRFGGVVFDPPRAGAEAQSRELAASKVARIAAVSCNPVTLARDAAILVTGGYKLLSVTPIDQFLWSHHVEAVALFER